MKITRKLLTLALAVLMLVSVLPLQAFAATYSVALHCGPEGWGSTAYPLTKTSGKNLALYHTKETVYQNYAMLPGKQVFNDQRTFIEWNTAYDSKTGRGTGTSYYDYYTADKAATLYAIWGYNIQFNADGGTYPKPTAGKDIYLTYVASYNLNNQSDPKTDYSYCLPDLFSNAPTKSGCRRVASSGRPAYALLEKDLTFFCWETADQNLTIPPTGGYMEWEYFHCADTAKGRAPEFYAIWEPSVTYKANGGSGSMSTDYLSWTGDALWEYESYKVRSNGFTKSGATFTGWNTKADGSGTAYKAGAQLGGQRTNSDPITLYAQWSDNSTPSTPTYTMTFDANGGTLSGTTTYSIKTGATYKSVIGSAMPTPTRSGYTFNGWYNEKYGYTLNLNDTFNVSENVTFKAQWTKNSTPEPETKKWTITFDPNGGTMVGSSTYGINTGDYYKDVFGSMPEATRSGYTLSGWYNEKYSYTLNMNDYFAISENATFKAQWTKKTYSTGVYKDDAAISMRSSASSSASVNCTVPADTQVTVTTLSGNWGYCQYGAYTGWIYLPDLTYVSTAADAKYVLTFDTNGGSMPSGYTTKYYFSPDAKFVDVIGGFPVPTRSGYSFEGWRRVDWTSDIWNDKWGSQPFTFGHDVILKAEWTKVEHTHSYTSAVTKAATCTEAGVMTYTCSCNDSYTETIPAIGHSYGRNETMPTCTEDGYITYTCANCSDTYTEEGGEATGHSYRKETTDATCTENGETVYICANCDDSYSEIIEAAGHSVVIVDGYDATCTENGLTSGSACSVCKEVLVPQETIEAIGHEYIKDVTDPTCTEEGYTTFFCFACGDSYVSDYVDALGHDYRAYTTDATCTENGETLYRCWECLDSYTETIPATGHSYDTNETEPTCTEDGYITHTCANCSDTYTEEGGKATGHSYRKELTDATCTEKGEAVYICDNCGDSYSETIDAYGHDYKATVIDATCGEGGKITYECTRCDESYVEEIPATGDHIYRETAYIEPTCVKDGSRVYSCVACGDVVTETIAATGSHGYKQTGETEPTCVTDGNRTFVCIMCGDVVTETIAATGAHGYVQTECIDPTCTEDGKIVFICTMCGDTVEEIQPATGYHDYVQTECIDPTCTEDGKIVFICTMCGDTVEEIQPATGYHDYVQTECIDPTCTEDGKIVFTCTMCGDTTEEIQPATGYHAYVQTECVEPTCTEAGYITYTCEGCSDSYTEENGEATGHSYREETTDATCTENGETVYICDNCGDSYSETIAAIGHDYISITVAATCTEDGVEVFTCNNCKHSYFNIIKATGHSYESVTTEPTCAEEGSRVYTCADCADSYTETIAKLEHTWGEWVETQAPSATQHGIMTRKCGSCGETETKYIPMLDADIPVIVDVTNYTVKINGIKDIKEIRYAIGTYSTGAEVRAAEKNQTLSAALVNSFTTDGVMTYEVPWIGEYTFWVRLNDGSQYFLYCDVREIDPYLVSDGLKLTVMDFGEGYKDMWIAEGTWNNYSEIKNNATVKYQAAEAKLSNYFANHDFTYTTANPGAHTVLIRYNDGTQDVLHIDLTVDVPTFDVNGLQVTVGNIPGVKIIRTAYGEYANVAEIKGAKGVRNFNNSTAIKDAETYKIQYRDNGTVTIIVEYNTGYKHVEHVNIAQKVPTFTQDGNKVTIGDLDGLVIVRYALGKYTTSNAIKNAEGSKYAKLDSANENGEIVIENLIAGTYTFCVQYDDESYNYYVIDVA